MFSRIESTPGSVDLFFVSLLCFLKLKDRNLKFHKMEQLVASSRRETDNLKGYRMKERQEVNHSKTSQTSCCFNAE